MTAPHPRPVPRGRVTAAAASLAAVVLLAAGCSTLPVAAGDGGRGTGQTPLHTAGDQTPSMPSATSSHAGRCQVSGSQVRGSQAGLDQERALLRESCERAMPAVAQYWTDWTGVAVIEIAAGDLEPGTAAYVAGLAREGEPAVRDRVVVASTLATDLTAQGLDVVFRHELTHLAMRSVGTAPLPSWASEGLAEHIAYASVVDERRERRRELEHLRNLLAEGAWSGTVPAAEPFDHPGTKAAAYTAAWLGIEVLLEALGTAKVLAAMSEHSPMARGHAGLDLDLDLDDPIRQDDIRTAALLAELGVSQAWFDAAWSSALARRTS